MTDTRQRCGGCKGRGVDEWGGTCLTCGGQGREPFREHGKEDDAMEMDILRQKIRDHLKWGPIEPRDRLRFLALALCGEAGELANLIKKDWRGDAGVDARREKVKEELADVGNYVFMMAEALGVDLPAAMLAKLTAVEARQEWEEHVRAP